MKNYSSLTLAEKNCRIHAAQEVDNWQKYGDARGPGHDKKVHTPAVVETPLLEEREEREQRVEADAPVVGGMVLAEATA